MRTEKFYANFRIFGWKEGKNETLLFERERWALSTEH